MPKVIRKSKGTFVAKAFALVLFASLVIPLLAIPTQAHVPPGVGKVEETELNPIWIYDENEELQKFVIQENDVRGYRKGGVPIEVKIEGRKYPDGELTICEVCVFRVVQAAISQLWPEEIPNQSDFEITWTHPYVGHGRAFKYITGGAAKYHRDIPPSYTHGNLTLDNYKYKFVNIDSGDVFEIEVQQGIFPNGFFELGKKVRFGKATEGEEVEFASQWKEVREKFLTLDMGELFVVEEEEEPVPI